ncbi:hypothetical protein [Sulfitobacter faviae]|uniref:hypothetical protein n=1 Tax=Sulfitobacter faviae TaxID=1775881 RepID=UPI00245639D0|nr:hypothetical protein [Sulfitobacter faviae]MDH4541030.1 hypothetical protein [Sulfitobacter faviae]
MTTITARLPKMDYHLPPALIRLRHPSGKYLHLSGERLTAGTDSAWAGTREQARKLRDRAKIRGEDWPFVAVRYTTKINTIEDAAA